MSNGDYEQLYQESLCLIAKRTGFQPGRPFVNAAGIRQCAVAGAAWDDRQIFVLARGESFTHDLFATLNSRR